ncbi:imidazole glycerol phosphate synthase subunit HisH [Campylobacter sp. RM12920]|uniref:Imidazole glycerol phosphate synthase subunit HisH n=1 Tax=Campylobacter californiensis TaxID=1032243 RepID=A0ABD4JKJ8_9BACT|nr:imidazole glycerol phosphate synthase subunit HisH [Campylobacter sp. RM12919]MBE2988569.1 imidazole glycerol phosphate synthase subunit HisH [Campylobacter sp. RM12920]
MIGIIDYKAGNIQSVINAFAKVGASCKLVSQANELKNYDKVVLPGVGAFAEAMNRLKDANMHTAIHEFILTGKPFLGICLGMQLLFEQSDEFGVTNGLGLIKGKVVKFDKAKFSSPLKIPHVGWNTINFTKKTPINQGLKELEYLYFVHSFHAICQDDAVLGESEYGYKFVSAVAKDNIYGFQPHPEKSHNVGLKILENFKEL